MLGSFLRLRKKDEFRWFRFSSIVGMLTLLCRAPMRVYLRDRAIKRRA